MTTTIGRPLQSATSAHEPRELRQPTRQKILADPVEQKLWDYYDVVEGIGSYVQVLSNTADVVSYFPAVDEGGSEPVGIIPELDDEGDPMPLTAPEQKTVDAYEKVGGETWLSTTVAELVKHLSVTGQAWLVPVKPDSEELAAEDADLEDVVWSVWSTFELRRSLNIVSQPDVPIPVEDERIWRIWMPHPKDGLKPDSPVRRVSDKCQILTLIDQSRSAQLGSNLFAGILPLPSSLRNEVTPSGKSWADVLEESMLEPIDNQQSTASLVPLMAYLEKEEADILAMGPIKMAIDDPSRLNELEDRMLRRIAIGIDAPVELITGMADLNHWTAWLIQAQTYEQHLDPLIIRILRSLTPWWRSYLEAQGVSTEDQTLWRNPASALHKPDLFDTAVKLHDRFVISDQALLEAADRDATDGPDQEEMTRRILTQALASPLALSAVPAIGEVAGEVVGGTPASDSPTETAAPALPIQAATVPQLDRLARKLARIDGEVLARMETEAAKQMRRLRRQITDRIAAAAKRQGHEIGDPDTLPMRLGPKTVGELVTGDLATPEDFDAVKFDSLIEGAQDDTASALSQIGATASDGGEDRTGAISTLLALLAAALVAGLYNPRESRGEDGIDGTELVPFNVLREALDVAGGGQAKRATEAWELIGNGKRTVDALDVIGVETAGFQWIYGTLPRRTFQPHLNLDGDQFERWDDPVLKQTTETWVGGEYWYPGDHRGCRCRYERTLIEPDA